ncbi:MAG: DUF2127 domain-containing protein [Acidimicrobiales bacterium]
MRLTPRHWHNETWICSIRGHVAPAATVAHLDPPDRRLGVEVDGERFVRCIRCDVWLLTTPPAPEAAEAADLESIVDFPRPRRGKVLQDAIVLRIVALNKGVHAAVFTLVALGLLAIEVKLPGLKASAKDLTNLLNQALDSAGRNPARQALAKGADRVLGLDPHEIKVLLAISAAYAVVESVEAIGLWLDKRWAEYVTAVATAGFLPLEIHELLARVTVVRIGALVINLAILVWLVLNKHLFGVRGGPHTLHADVDWEQILNEPTPAPYLQSDGK